VQFALLGPERVGAAIRSRPLRSIRSRCTLSPRRLSPNVGPRVCFLRGDASQRPGCGPSARPLFILALEEPSPNPSRPLTLSRRSAAPACRLLFRPPASAPCASLAYGVDFTARARIVPPSPRSEEPSPQPVGHTRRWRNDPERLPSYRLSLRACADPYGVSAAETRRLATPDRATHHASSVTIRRDACAPFRYARRFHPASYTERPCACAPDHSARRDSPG